MKYERTMTEKELAILGNDAAHKIDVIINSAISSLLSTQNIGSIQTRFLNIMSTEKPLSPTEITEAHNIIYATNPIRVSYTRVVLTGMLKSNQVQRVTRGRYIRK